MSYYVYSSMLGLGLAFIYIFVYTKVGGGIYKLTEVLSKDNIENLLSSIEEVQSINREQKTAAVDDLILKKTIKLYDFRHPDRFSKEQMRTIEIMHETFSRLVTNNLSTQLRTLVDIHIASVHQITYEEFTRTIPNPTLFSIIDMQPFNGSAILEIDPSVTFAIVERLFGGDGTLLLDRELTEIEQAVAENIIDIMLGYLREAWHKIVNLRPHLVQIETNPQLAQVVPPNEMMLMIVFNCRIDNVEGMINIAIPHITIDPIVSKLSAYTWYASTGANRTSITTEEHLKSNMTNLDLEVKAVLGQLNLPVGQILNLKKGDVLALHDVKYKNPIKVLVGEEEKFKGIPGVIKSRRAVKIIEVLDQYHSSSLSNTNDIDEELI